MDNIWIQYIFIAFLFGFAVWYVVKLIKNSFSSKGGGCSKGCGCSPSKDEFLKKKANS